jgi:phenylpyruvate tautomerase PptA (4-oxalocrotonate tautomerase family)
MPYLMLQTNTRISDTDKTDLLKNLSAKVAISLGKPENYVMIAIEDCTPMLFAGSDAPLAYLELKSIGLPESKTMELSATLCTAINEVLGIDTNRIYIEFADAPRGMWGWDKHTF